MKYGPVFSKNGVRLDIGITFIIGMICGVIILTLLTV